MCADSLVQFQSSQTEPNVYFANMLPNQYIGKKEPNQVEVSSVLCSCLLGLYFQNIMLYVIYTKYSIMKLIVYLLYIN